MLAARHAGGCSHRPDGNGVVEVMVWVAKGLTSDPDDEGNHSERAARHCGSCAGELVALHVSSETSSHSSLLS